MSKIDKSKKLLVLGGFGRIGYSLVEQLDQAGYTDLLVPTSKMCNLLDDYSCEAYFRKHQPQKVINLCAKNTTIALCNDYPASICRDTLQMNMTVLDLCQRYAVEKLVNIICSCSYDGNTPILREEEFWSGSPHPSIMSHGLAKRTVYYLDKAYNKQYGMNVITLALNNVFGNARWEKPTSLKFLDSLILKISQAKIDKLKYITLWGSGNPAREIIHYTEAAKGILSAFEEYNSPELLNIGNGIDKTIKEWAELVSSILKYKGRIEYDQSKPDGQLKKLFSVEKMYKEISFRPSLDFESQIKNVSDQYKEYLKNKNANI